MKKMEREYRQYKKIIEQKQELAILLESVLLLDSSTCKSYIDYDYIDDSKQAFSIDIVHYNFMTLYHKCLPKLIEDNFLIELDSHIAGIYDWIDTTKKIDPQKSLEIKNLNYNMISSFDFLKHHIERDLLNQVDLIKIFVQNGLYEIMMNLLVSEQVPKNIKFHMMRFQLSDSHHLTKFLNTTPLDYQNCGKEENNFHELLQKNLLEIFNDKEDYIEELIRFYIAKSCQDQHSLNAAEEVIKFFVNYNLVDINNIVWKYNNQVITSAVAAFIVGKNNLSTYLYNLPGYLNQDYNIKDYSDMIMLESIILNGSPRDVKKFISQANYTNTAEKMLFTMDMIASFNQSNENHSYNTSDVTDITNILFRKTKKEEYKKIKQTLESRQAEEKELTKKRQEFTTQLVILNETLLEQVPAKQVIKKLTFKK